MAKVTVKDGNATIQTSRLLLRKAHQSDLQGLHIAMGDEEVMRYWSTPPHDTDAKTQAYLANMIESPCNGILDFLLVLRSSETVIGKAGIWCSDPTNPEIGFMLAREYWGKGLMAEALGAWLQYLWSEACETLVAGEQTDALDDSGGGALEGDEGGIDAGSKDSVKDGRRRGGIDRYKGARVERVVADADPRNEACLGVMRRFGFKETGRAEKTYETHLGWCDSVYFELERPKL